MEQITLRIGAETLEELEDEAEDQDASRSEYIRHILESRSEHAEHNENTDELHGRIEELERDLERVRREKQMILEEREEKQELVRYVEDERSAEQQWREAALTKRLKWRVFGMPSEDT